MCLTNAVENSRIKCFQYWPNIGEMLHFDELTVVTLDEVSTNDGECVIRKIEVSRDDDDSASEPPRIVEQFHLTKWADHGVPTSTKALLELCMALITQMKAVRSSTSSEDEETPILVHCSAGVGRTGTLIAITLIIKDILNGAEEVDVANVVKQLREQRPKMVQTIVGLLSSITIIVSN